MPLELRVVQITVLSFWVWLAVRIGMGFPNNFGAVWESNDFFIPTRSRVSIRDGIRLPMLPDDVFPPRNDIIMPPASDASTGIDQTITDSDDSFLHLATPLRDSLFLRILLEPATIHVASGVITAVAIPIPAILRRIAGQESPD
jgi:hypothetical protein